MAEDGNVRYLRYILLLGEGVLLVLRGIIRKEVFRNGSTLEAILTASKSRSILESKCSSETQRLHLYPTNSTVNSDIDTWDISLLMLVLQRLFWNNFSADEQKNISSLRANRNEFQGHPPALSMDETDYATRSTDLIRVLQDLALGLDQHIQDELNRIIKNSNSVDFDYHAAINSLQKLYEFKEEMLQKLRIEFETVSLRHENIQGEIKDHKQMTSDIRAVQSHLHEDLLETKFHAEENKRIAHATSETLTIVQEETSSSREIAESNQIVLRNIETHAKSVAEEVMKRFEKVEENVDILKKSMDLIGKQENVDILKKSMDLIGKQEEKPDTMRTKQAVDSEKSATTGTEVVSSSRDKEETRGRFRCFVEMLQGIFYWLFVSPQASYAPAPETPVPHIISEPEEPRLKAFEEQNGKENVLENRLMFKSIEMYSVEDESDTKLPRITKIEMLPDDRILLADFSNRRLKMLDSSFKCVSYTDLNDVPLSVCYIGNDRAAVSLDYAGIQIVNVSDHLVIEQRHKLDHCCSGLARYGDTLYIIDGEGTVYTYTIEVRRKRVLYRLPCGPLWLYPMPIAVSDDGQRIYFGSVIEGLITIDNKGNHVSTLGTNGLIISADISVVGDGTFLVCNHSGATVLVDYEGKKVLKAVLLNPIVYPRCLYFYSKCLKLIGGVECLHVYELHK